MNINLFHVLSLLFHRPRSNRRSNPHSKSYVCMMGDEGSLFDKLDNETAIYVFSMLNTCKDLVNAACVCRLWREYVMEEKLWRGLCMKHYHESGDFKIVHMNESGSLEQASDIRQLGYPETKLSLYAMFLSTLQSSPIERSCILEPLHASSTDNLPQESIVQTLYHEDELNSYWSSTGQSNTNVPETLTYRLLSDLCVVHEVKIRPFRANFQDGDPIYSSQMVRFRFGYSHTGQSPGSGVVDCLSDQPRNINMGDYVWTYESPAFPMAQEDTLQSFRLPRPVLCIGGIFQVELIGRVQTQAIDSLYYICIAYVHVHGFPVSDFKLESIGKGGKYSFKYLLEQERCESSRTEQRLPKKAQPLQLIR